MGTLPMTHTPRANDDQVYTLESVGHALIVAHCCVSRLHVVALLSEASPSAEDTDAAFDDAGDDEDEPLQEFRRCLQAMASGKSRGSLGLGGRLITYALQGGRKEGSRKGMTRTQNGKEE